MKKVAMRRIHIVTLLLLVTCAWTADPIAAADKRLVGAWLIDIERTLPGLKESIKQMAAIKQIATSPAMNSMPADKVEQAVKDMEANIERKFRSARIEITESILSISMVEQEAKKIPYRIIEAKDDEVTIETSEKPGKPKKMILRFDGDVLTMTDEAARQAMVLKRAKP
jgi:hypothetical protein